MKYAAAIRTITTRIRRDGGTVLVPGTCRATAAITAEYMSNGNWGRLSASGLPRSFSSDEQIVEDGLNLGHHLTFSSAARSVRPAITPW